ncbi:hypothetical protein LTR85_008057 [Meristemomyces frigidus]|nr:hypothetical protein LTR85_008057 [Meristemomyces frigidus]
MPPGTATALPVGGPEQADVLIVGSGPIGATFARQIVDAGRKVLMIDIGDQGSRRIGDHKKNSVAVQKDISLFTSTVRGELSLLSVPVDQQQDAYAEPVSWEAKPRQFVHNGQNPNQLAWDNLPAAAASRIVGGMGNHWTCCTPEQFPGIERSTIFTPSEWQSLYGKARALFHTNSTSYDQSIRHQLVKHVLLDAYKGTGREFTGMPLACQRNEPNKDYVEWTCPATILGDLSEPGYDGGLFELRPNTQCVQVQIDPVTGQVAWLVVKDTMQDRTYAIRASKYVICAGAVLTPGILFNSGLGQETLPALGHYLTEQNMAFCQVLLKRSLVDHVKDDPWSLGWKKIVEHHQQEHPEDPLPFPFNDPDPQVYTPFTEEHPWHTQIHRDAFGYGEVPATIDQRLVVDLRFFGYNKPVYENCVEFNAEIQDGFGMPQVRIVDRALESVRKAVADNNVSQRSTFESIRLMLRGFTQ